MFKNVVYGGVSQIDSELKIVASGYRIDPSSYVVIVQDMNGNVIDVEIKALEGSSF